MSANRLVTEGYDPLIASLAVLIGGVAHSKKIGSASVSHQLADNQIYSNSSAGYFIEDAAHKIWLKRMLGSPEIGVVFGSQITRLIVEEIEALHADYFQYIKNSCYSR